ncbi:MAG TPA: TIGR03808 family TAT-translocated repetitive protein [Xanthobacteraceae bacterium]|nr:TIGR03808 family TAT-translocated repetitive protein [Xanthobacteraceae bacterium]
MELDRRRLLTLTAAAGAGVSVSSAQAAPAASPASALGVDGAQFGLRPGSADDQSRTLQRAIDEVARSRAPLALAPGVYRVGNIKLPAGAQLVGTRGATRLLLTDGPSLIAANGADNVMLSGLVLDGGRRPLPDRRGLVQLENCRSIKIADCEIREAGRNGLVCVAVDGAVIDTTIADSADVALHALDSRGLTIARNSIRDAGNNGIQVWRSAAGDDGTIVTDNRIENIANRSGGSGQYGNAVNVFRAGNVIVRGNRIKNCAFTAVRGNAASNIHIEGNSIVDVREVALYAEFGFEGALIANNTVDGAAIGVSVTNFNEGGRLAVVQGNIIRNLYPKRPPGTDPGDSGGVGIAVEADTAVTGNVVENAPTAGIMLGWGHYLRDVAVTGNVVRKADIGIAVSVAPGAGSALIANNMISETGRGAIVGMARAKPITGDLAKGGVEQYANLAVSGNRVR